MASSSRIAELAQTIQANTAKVDNYFRENNLPQPTFAEDGPTDFGIKSPEVEKARLGAIAGTLELYDLLMGPAMNVRPVLNGAPLQAIHKFDIPSKVPIGGQISFEQLAEKCDLHEPDLRRLLRFAMVWYRIFQEKTPGFVSHTAASRRLAEDPAAMMGVGFMFDEVYQGFAHTVEALETYKNFEPNGAGWNVARRTELPLYEYHKEHPELGKRFGGAMSTFTRGLGLGPEPLLKGYDWSSIGANNSSHHGTIIDVGGSKGHTSMAIARAHPDLHFIVQELPNVVDSFRKEIPADLTDRVEFMAHDFFEPQPIKNADVYFFRQIFHNWPDPSCVQILKALVPALKPGTKVVANDHLVPPPGSMPLMQDRAVRDMDLIMMTLFNAREREVRDWEKLFEMADNRFKDVKVWMPEGSSLCIVEATWSG